MVVEQAWEWDGKKKVVIFNPASYLGGAERGLIEIIETLKDSYKIKVFHPDSGGSLGDFLGEYSYPVSLTYFTSFSRTQLFHLKFKEIFSLLKELFSLFIKVKKESPDILITNGIKSHLIFIVFNFFLEKKLIVFWRDAVKKNLINKVIFQIIGQYSDLIIVNSEETRNYFSFVERKVKLIPNPSCNMFFRKESKRHKNKKKLILGIVANLAPLKGIEDALLVSPFLKDDLKTEIEIKVAGGNIYKTNTSYYSRYALRLKKLKEKLNSQGIKVEFKRYSWNEMAFFYSQIDFLINPSRREGFGRSIAEAICYQIPFVTTQVGYWKDKVSIIGEEHFYKAGNLEDLKEKIKIILKKEINWSKLKGLLWTKNRYKTELLKVIKDIEQ